MENLDWTTDELRNIADQICTGLEDILERTRIDAAKPIYENTQTKAQFNVILRHPASARIVAISERTGNEIELYVCPVAPPVGKPGQTSTFSHPVRPHDRPLLQKVVFCKEAVKCKMMRIKRTYAISLIDKRN